MQIHYDILDEKRLQILSKLQAFKQDFYLAGGTGLALLFGHRDSVDFDFFSTKEFKVDELADAFLKIFEGHKVLFVQKEQGTLTAILDDEIKISFFFKNGFYIEFKEVQAFLEKTVKTFLQESVFTD